MKIVLAYIVCTTYICFMIIRNTDKVKKQLHLEQGVVDKLTAQAKEAGFPNFKNYTEWILINHSKQAK